MPKRLTTSDVKNLFEKYGYQVPKNFTYRNNKQRIRVYDEQNETHETMTYQQLQYRIKRAATKRQPYFDKNLMNLPIAGGSDTDDTDPGYRRWLARQSDEFNDLDNEYKREAYQYYCEVMPIVSRKRNTTLRFNQNEENKPKLYGLVEALKTVDFTRYDVRLTVKYNGITTYMHANENTINLLYDSFFNDDLDVTDSASAIITNIVEFDSIFIEFRPKNMNGARIAPGFFPWTHRCDSLDLSRYAIYRHEEDISNEPCLVTAIRSSGLLDSDQLQLLSSMVKTRNVLKSDLRKIAETFGLFIYVQIITDYKTGKTSHTEYGNPKDPKLKLLIMYDHYMFNETVQTPFSKRKMSLFKLIQKLKEDGMLVELSDNIKKKLIISFQQVSDRDVVCKNSYRPIKVPDVKINKYIQEHKVKQTKRLFGYTPDDNEIDDRLKELQKAIDTLPLRKRIDVSNYYRFSDLGQKILYECGCYDGVYELTGKLAHDIRDSLQFPKTKMHASYLQGKYYYLDLNAAYMAFVKYIPSGLNNGYVNRKVGQIIKQLYDLRIQAKNEGNNKLATTLKFIMNSTWGYSISRPKNIKHKYAQNPDTYIQKFNRFILKQCDHFVDVVNCFVDHYTFPQFAQAVLSEYNKFFTHIKSMINVYYENVDALLTDEEGYNKLLEMGLIDDSKIGCFKIDKVFTEFAAISDRRYVAKTIDGEEVYHCINKLSYEDVVKISRQI